MAAKIFNNLSCAGIRWDRGRGCDPFRIDSRSEQYVNHDQEFSPGYGKFEEQKSLGTGPPQDVSVTRWNSD